MQGPRRGSIANWSKWNRCSGGWHLDAGLATSEIECSRRIPSSPPHTRQPAAESERYRYFIMPFDGCDTSFPFNLLFSWFCILVVRARVKLPPVLARIPSARDETQLVFLKFMTFKSFPGIQIDALCICIVDDSMTSCMLYVCYAASEAADVGDYHKWKRTSRSSWHMRKR